MIFRANAIFITWISTFLCDGRLLWKDEDLDIDLKRAKERPDIDNSDTKDLLKTILDAIENCKEGNAAWLANQDRLPSCAEEVESLVVDLPQNKRKALKEILGLALTPGAESVAHKNDKGNDIQMADNFKLFSHPAAHSISAEQLLWNLLDPNTTATTPADLDYLQQVIYGEKKHDLKEDTILMKTVDNFLRDISMNNREVYHFA